MTPEEVIQHFGNSQTSAAQRLGVTQSAVAQWVAKGYVPTCQQYRIQVLTAGHLVAAPRSDGEWSSTIDPDTDESNTRNTVVA